MYPPQVCTTPLGLPVEPEVYTSKHLLLRCCIERHSKMYNVYKPCIPRRYAQLPWVCRWSLKYTPVNICFCAVVLKDIQKCIMCINHVSPAGMHNSLGFAGGA